MKRRLAVRTRISLLVIGALLGLAGCTLPGGIELRRPTPIPSPTAAALTPSSTPEIGATPPAGGTTDTPAPPTAAPPEMGEPAELPRLAADSELEISEIEMFSALEGWALGGEEEGQGRVLRTADGGQRWLEVTPPVFFGEGGAELLTAAHFLDADRAWVLRYAAVEVAMPSESGLPLIIWSTEDGGASWQHSRPRFAPFVGTASARPYLEVNQDGQGWLLARAGGAGMHQHPVSLLRTEDGNDSWQLLQEPFSGQGLDSCYKSGMAFSDGGQGALTIASCPITGAEVRLTLDGGRSWQPVSLAEPAPPADLYDQAVCESHSPHWLDRTLLLGVNCRTFEGEAAAYDFLYRLEQDGTPGTINPYLGGRLLPVDDQVVFALGREIHRSLDGGESWQQRKLVAWDGQFTFVSAELGWAVARSGDEIALVVTTDGANRWQIVEPRVGGGGG